MKKVIKNEAANKKLYNEMINLFNNHRNNGGELSFSEKDYSYLLDDIEYIEVLYLQDDEVDSDWANELRDLLELGYISLLNDNEAFNLMTARLNNISLLS